MLKIITANLNGIRSAERKGFFVWLKNQNADVICLQEIKAQDLHLSDSKFQLEGYQSFFQCAQKSGYSGVGIYARNPPKRVQKSFGCALADQEGRYLQIDFKDLSIISVYLPSGSSGEERQKIKFEFMSQFGEFLKRISQEKRSYILCGDWNIVHQRIDIANWNGNQKNSGCLPEERAWLDEIFKKIGFVDAFRHLNQNPNEYTWWSQRGQARAKNVGWRIDYQIVSPQVSDKIKTASIYRDQSFSDHAPVVIEYDLVV